MSFCVRISDINKLWALNISLVAANCESICRWAIISRVITFTMIYLNRSLMLFEMDLGFCLIAYFINNITFQQLSLLQST